MLKINESKTYNATSVVDVDGVPKPVAYMNATIPIDGSMSTNNAIQDQELFKLHREEVLADIKEFADIIYADD